MNPKPPIIIILPLIFMLLFSCREVYYPEGLNGGKAIPIIKGQIIEDASPTVVMSRAMDYGSSVPEYIRGALVRVTDDQGNEVTLTESDPGHYVDAMGEMYGTIGNAYQLHVKMADGEEFESSVVTMPEKPFADSLYADPGTLEGHVYDQFNKPVAVTYEGLYFSASLSANGDSTQFYRFNTTVLTESQCLKWPGTPSSSPMYIWQTSTLDNIYSVDFTVNSDGGQVRPERTLGFVQYFYDPSMATDLYTAPIITGWVVTLNVYSISSDVYNYYQSVGAQLNSKDQMFAPVPSQVKSNIYCNTQSELPVAGVFEATSKRTYYKAFRWININTYESFELESFPDGIQSGSKLYSPPIFWISF